MTRPQASSEDLVYWIGEDVGKIDEDSGIDDFVGTEDISRPFPNDLGRESIRESIYVTLFEREFHSIVQLEC
jgi:hypothetical protein